MSGTGWKFWRIVANSDGINYFLSILKVRLKFSRNFELQSLCGKLIQIITNVTLFLNNLSVKTSEAWSQPRCGGCTLSNTASYVAERRLSLTIFTTYVLLQRHQNDHICLFFPRLLLHHRISSDIIVIM